jgi:hypothetical protein
MAIELILSLTPEEKKWWKSTIQEYRAKIIKGPKEYAAQILEEMELTKESLQGDFDSILFNVREGAWQLYLKDECRFHAEVISYLGQERALPREILKEVIERNISKHDLNSLTDQNLLETIGRVVGDYTGRIMPYIYDLSLSTTQSRRSRAGTTFENIIEAIMDAFSLPYKNQSSLGKDFYTNNNLGKKVDLIVPGPEEYARNRAKCAVVTMKTSLRERWQEVAEELSRTNVPHIYLLTLDPNVTENVVRTIKQYNITLVLPTFEKAKFSTHDNVLDFTVFFTRELPHIVAYWAQ